MPFSSTSTRRPLFTKDGAITVGEGVIGSSLHSRRNRPLFVRENLTSTKAYICTFMYACSRMTHLNLTTDLSTNKIFQALIRVISGRWLCSTIWSDNAKMFKRCRSRDPTVVHTRVIRRWATVGQTRSRRAPGESDGGSSSNVLLGVVAGGRGSYVPWRNLFARF